MKPRDLTPPFPTREWVTTIHDRVWYVPTHLDNGSYAFPGWEHPEIFGNAHPVHVEYCSGNGAWIIERALENPHINWVALEKKFKRVKKIWSKMKNLGLKNLFIICGEASHVTRHYFPKESISEVFINFPDPWPKKRHAKNRLIKSEFLEEVWETLCEGGPITSVTDDPNYSAEIVDVFSRQVGYTSSYPEPYFVTDVGDYGSSYFDSLWREMGRTIHYHQFTKMAAACENCC